MKTIVRAVLLVVLHPGDRAGGGHRLDLADYAQLVAGQTLQFSATVRSDTAWSGR